ncbi:hypothetical protein EMA8858_00131 [Emticicia aquatica]|jgi:hypothetical protein|uniref:Uncharacterized protein n=1 Tax=Emticicia aquatica TaxID=1681835 RepID=A0ABM9AKG4_9BACT|nr:hypothetical protein [Emticicia aquatica]CAH0994024.1 hypothetical protein EMA8858_00131 [Emticicia aquatica]
MRTLVIVLQILGGLTFIPWFTVAGLSFISLNSSESIKKIGPWLFIISIFIYPFIVGGCYWWAWSIVLTGDLFTAALWSCLPLICFGVAYLIISQTSDYLKRY